MNATKTLQRTLAMGALLAATLATSAHAYDQNASRAGTSAQCEQARLSAWFDAFSRRPSMRATPLSGETQD